MRDANLPILKFIWKRVVAIHVRMSRALQLAVCIQEVEQSIKEINDHNQICGVLVQANFSLYINSTVHT